MANIEENNTDAVVETEESIEIKTCMCPNTKCKRHGNCELCAKNHGNKKMYCRLKDGSFRKKLCDKMFANKAN